MNPRYVALAWCLTMLTALAMAYSFLNHATWPIVTTAVLDTAFTVVALSISLYAEHLDDLEETS